MAMITEIVRLQQQVASMPDFPDDSLELRQILAGILEVLQTLAESSARKESKDG
jgi:hypothetical protein